MEATDWRELELKSEVNLLLVVLVLPDVSKAHLEARIKIHLRWHWRSYKRRPQHARGPAGGHISMKSSWRLAKKDEQIYGRQQDNMIVHVTGMYRAYATLPLLRGARGVFFLT